MKGIHILILSFYIKYHPTLREGERGRERERQRERKGGGIEESCRGKIESTLCFSPTLIVPPPLLFPYFPLPKTYANFPFSFLLERDRKGMEAGRGKGRGKEGGS